jgi:hypothetical protein
MAAVRWSLLRALIVDGNNPADAWLELAGMAVVLSARLFEIVGGAIGDAGSVKSVNAGLFAVMMDMFGMVGTDGANCGVGGAGGAGGAGLSDVPFRKKPSSAAKFGFSMYLLKSTLPPKIDTKTACRMRAITKKRDVATL